jgi:hypothetical protein
VSRVRILLVFNCRSPIRKGSCKDAPCVGVGGDLNVVCFCEGEVVNVGAGGDGLKDSNVEFGKALETKFTDVCSKRV